MEKKSNWQKDLEKLLVQLGWGGVKGGRTGKSVDDRDWNDCWRQCVEGGEVEVGS